MNKNRVLVIFEGSNPEKQIFQSIISNFFQVSINTVIFDTKSYNTNIYSLYKGLEDHDFLIDTIDYLLEEFPDFQNSEGDIVSREMFSEIYLFFDLDSHHFKECIDPQTMVDDRISIMLNHFNNETENGKLFIHYPMSESLFHLTNGCISTNVVSIKSFTSLSQKDAQDKKYKQIAKYNTIIDQFTSNKWDMLLEYYVYSYCYLSDTDLTISYNSYLNDHIALETYVKQYTKFIDPHSKIIVLSGFSQFVLDYFGEGLFESISNRINKDVNFILVDYSKPTI